MQTTALRRSLSALLLPGLLLASWTVLRREPAPAIPEPSDDLQLTSLQSWLWPGAFQVPPSSDRQTVDFLAGGGRYLAKTASDGFVIRDPHSERAIEVSFTGAKRGASATLSESFAAPFTVFAKQGSAAHGVPWQRYRRIVYSGIYPGIDLVFRRNDGDLEFDFELNPGADPALLRLEASGDTHFVADAASGDVYAANGEQRYRIRKARAYQLVNAVQQDIAVRMLVTSRSIRFDVDDYDRARPLIIDPLIASYATFVGTNGDDRVTGVATDAAGNVYLTGSASFDSRQPNESGFPTTAQSLHLPYARAGADSPCYFGCAYILKLDANQNVIYGAVLPPMDPAGIAVDLNGGAYITGRALLSTEFPATPGVFSNDPVGQAFVLKLSADGTELAYSALFRAAEGKGIAVDGAGAAYVVGLADSPGLPTTPNSVKPDSQPNGDRINDDGFLLKINPAGTSVEFGTYLGGTGRDRAFAVAVDDSGIAAVAGSTTSDDFTGFSAEPLGGDDAFAITLAADGSAITHGKLLGGSAGESALGIARDRHGGWLVAGATQSSDFPATSGVIQERLLGERNGFLVRLDAAFNVVYSTFFGGSFIDGLLAVDADAEANAYLAGVTFSPDMLTTPDALQSMTSAVSSDPLAAASEDQLIYANDLVREAFVAVLTSDGQRLTYGSYLGGFYTVPRGFDALTISGGIARSTAGVVYVGGTTLTASFPVTDGGLRSGMGGINDGFLVKLAPGAVTITNRFVLPQAPVERPYSVQLQASGGVAPYRWTLAGFSLPDGLSLTPTGLITGMTHNDQTETNGYHFTVKVVDAVGAVGYKSLYIQVHYPGLPLCADSHCEMRLLVRQGVSFRPRFPARGVPPFTLSITGVVPPGMTIDQSNGFLEGEPTTAGDYTFREIVRDSSAKTASLTWHIIVTDPNAPAPPAPPPPSPPPGNGGGGTSSGGGGGGAFSYLFLLALGLFRLVYCLRKPFRGAPPFLPTAGISSMMSAAVPSSSTAGTPWTIRCPLGTKSCGASNGALR